MFILVWIIIFINQQNTTHKDWESVIMSLQWPDKFCNIDIDIRPRAILKISSGHKMAYWPRPSPYLFNVHILLISKARPWKCHLQYFPYLQWTLADLWDKSILRVFVELTYCSRRLSFFFSFREKGLFYILIKTLSVFRFSFLASDFGFCICI